MTGGRTDGRTDGSPAMKGTASMAELPQPSSPTRLPTPLVCCPYHLRVPTVFYTHAPPGHCPAPTLAAQAERLDGQGLALVCAHHPVSPSQDSGSRLAPVPSSRKDSCSLWIGPPTPLRPLWALIQVAGLHAGADGAPPGGPMHCGAHTCVGHWHLDRGLSCLQPFPLAV